MGSPSVSHTDIVSQIAPNEEGVFESIAVGIVTLESSGTVRSINHAARRLFGHATVEIVGRDISELIPALSSSAELVSEKCVNQSRRRMVGQRKDGSTFALDVVLSEVESSHVARFVAVVHDISAREEGEAERHRNDELLSTVSEVQSQFIVDGDARAAFRRLLEHVIQLSQSEYGLVAELTTDELGKPSLTTHAVVNGIVPPACLATLGSAEPTEGGKMRVLLHKAINSGQPVMTKALACADTCSSATDEPALALPIRLGNRVVGVVGLAARGAVYDDRTVAVLEPLLRACGNLVGALEQSRQHTDAEEALREANEQLNLTLATVRERNEQITHLSELEEYLQSCDTREEAAKVVQHVAERLFEFNSGALHMPVGTDAILECVASWGDEVAPPIFQSQDCFATRRGRPHSTVRGETPLRCRHVDDEHDAFCVPLIGKSESFGVLQIYGRRASGVTFEGNAVREIAVTAGRRIALAFANLKLSETLREQSTCDPLTGLFNRRHMEEAFEREIMRADRSPNGCVSVVTFDLDHFKMVNDMYGHPAGDEVLIAFSELLRRSIRGGDLACRLGGEEFLLILPGCPGDGAAHRAEAILDAVRGLEVALPGGAKIRFTASAGVAWYPDAGRRTQTILSVADTALYEAKQAGRDQVVVAPMCAATIDSIVA